MKIKGIVMCEESQAVTKAFRRLGVEVYSNDLKSCSGGHPEWHLKMPAQEAILVHDFTFAIAHPPCTHLCVSGTRHFAQKIKDGRQQAGIDLFLWFTKLPILHICLENPIGIMSSIYMKPTQIIEPHHFGDKAKKPTCLWLKNLPPLFHSSEVDMFNTNPTHVDMGKFRTTSSGKRFSEWEYKISKEKHSQRGELRSKTFKGIANAMAEQWTDYLEYKYQNKI